MAQEYLKIARQYVTKQADTESQEDWSRTSERSEPVETHPQVSPNSGEISELCEISAADRVSAALAAIDEREIARAYDTKATTPGQKPPLVQVQELIDLAQRVDWRVGVRCGRTGQQCRVCKGVPCVGSTEW